MTSKDQEIFLLEEELALAETMLEHWQCVAVDLRMKMLLEKAENEKTDIDN